MFSFLYVHIVLKCRFIALFLFLIWIWILRTFVSRIHYDFVSFDFKLLSFFYSTIVFRLSQYYYSLKKSALVCNPWFTHSRTTHTIKWNAYFKGNINVFKKHKMHVLMKKDSHSQYNCFKPKKYNFFTFKCFIFHSLNRNNTFCVDVTPTTSTFTYIKRFECLNLILSSFRLHIFLLKLFLLEKYFKIFFCWKHFHVE